jgi:AraC-like DNA-binding protein
MDGSPVNVVTWTAPARAAALRTRQGYAVDFVQDSHLLHRRILDRAPGILVIDPRRIPDDADAARTAAHQSGWLVVFDYAHSTDAALALLAQLAWRPKDLLRPEREASLDHLRLGDATAPSAELHFLQHVADGVLRLPPAIGAAAVGCALGVTHAETVTDLAHLADVAPRTVNRHFSAAGLSSPRRFLVAARLVRGVNDLLTGDESVEVIAARWGIGCRRTLAREALALTGFRPGELRRRRVSAPRLVAIIAARLRRTHRADYPLSHIAPEAIHA